MPQTRLDQDVFDLAQEVANACGLSSPRSAIEAIVRLNAKYYVQRMQRDALPDPIPAPTPVSAQECLSSLLAEI